MHKMYFVYPYRPPLASCRGTLQHVIKHLTLNKSADENICQRWNGSFFAKDSLQNLGLRYQLGHSSAPCPCPCPGQSKFVVFDLSGPHNVSIDYCQCGEEQLPFWTQLLREGWFPATLSRPQTAFTFDCLETFHELTLQGKTNIYDFYNTLLRRSDNANLTISIVSIAIIFLFIYFILTAHL